MATQREAPRFVAVTRIERGRTQEFERLIPALSAAVEQVRPHLSGRWQLLRPDTDDESSDVAAYVFLFYGDVPLDEWDIEALCKEALGEEEGRQLAEQVLDCFDDEQDVYAISGEVALGPPSPVESAPEGDTLP